MSTRRKLPMLLRRGRGLPLPVLAALGIFFSKGFEHELLRKSFKPFAHKTPKNMQKQMA